MKKHAWLAKSANEYEMLGLKKGTPLPWEDGLRTDGKAGSYEWWYFDTKLEDGSSLVIVFYSFPMFSFGECCLFVGQMGRSMVYLPYHGP